MADRIVQLEDEDNNNLFPIAGGTGPGMVTRTMLQDDVAIVSDTLSQPNSVAYVDTANIIDAAVTSDKIDWTTIQLEPYIDSSVVTNLSRGVLNVKGGIVTFEFFGDLAQITNDAEHTMFQFPSDFGYIPKYVQSGSLIGAAGESANTPLCCYINPVGTKICVGRVPTAGRYRGNITWVLK